MDTPLHDLIIDRANYWACVVLMMLGLFAMISKNNLIKKLIGMSIFQTAIILFYVSIGVKEGAGIPIVPPAPHGEHHAAHDEAHHPAGHPTPKASAAHPAHPAHPDPAHFANPLPHVLMLTAIVVGVSTLGVALAVCQLLYRDYGTLEEDEILDRIQATNDG